MRYIEFKTRIKEELTRHPSGLTWRELKHNLDLPYKQPCPTWVRQLEEEIDLVRVKEGQTAFTWKLPASGE